MSSLYYDPASWGLEQIAQVGWEDYQWSITVVYKDDDGQLWLADDSGCSCYGPFQDIHNKSDLIHLTNIDVARGYADQYDSSYYTVTEDEKLTFLNDIRKYL